MGDERELALARGRAAAGAGFFSVARTVVDHALLYEALIARACPARLPQSEMSSRGEADGAMAGSGRANA